MTRHRDPDIPVHVKFLHRGVPLDICMLWLNVQQTLIKLHFSEYNPAHVRLYTLLPSTEGSFVMDRRGRNTLNFLSILFVKNTCSDRDMSAGVNDWSKLHLTFCRRHTLNKGCNAFPHMYE